MSESLPKVYVAWRDGEDDLVAAHGPDRDPADRAGEANYRQPDAWARRAIVNVGHSGKFFSDRTIMEYARSIWTAEACPVDQS